MLNWSVYVPFFSFSKDLPSLRGLCLIVVPSWALCMHIIPVYHRFTRLEKAELSNCQSKLNIIHPFFLAFHTGSVWATAWSVGAVKVESSPGAVPLLGTLGKVVQVSAAGPHQRVLRGENRDLLRVAGWVTEGGDDCAGLSLLNKKRLLFSIWIIVSIFLINSFHHPFSFLYCFEFFPFLLDFNVFFSPSSCLVTYLFFRYSCKAQ